MSPMKLFSYLNNQLDYYMTAGADPGFLKGGLFFGKALVLEARGPRGHVPPRFFEEGAQGAPCCEEMSVLLVMIMPC